MEEESKVAIMEKRRQLTTSMLPSLSRRLKVYAASEEKTVADVLEELVKDYLDRVAPQTEPPSG